MGKFSTIKVRVPDTTQVYKYGKNNYSQPNVKRANIALLKKINSDYGTIIRYWGTIFETGENLITAFIATESGGKMVAPNRFNATGLMQVTPPSFYDCFKKWKNEVDAEMPEQAFAEVQSKLPELIKAKSYSSAIGVKIINVLKSDANFNVMAGTLVLRWLLERFSSVLFGGQLNKAMVAYNAGAYTRSLVVSGTKTTANTNPVDTAALVANPIVPLESRNYLLKMLGKDGFLELLVVGKALTA
jgi:soluble lytic murein transglycosylase-like protein